MYKIMLQNTTNLRIEWHTNYKRRTQAEQAAHTLRKKFKDPFWKAYYNDITPKVVKK